MTQAGVEVIGGAGSEIALKVDPTSKAARVTLYDSHENLIDLNPRVVGSYEAPIAVPVMAYTTTAVTPRTMWRMFSYESSRFVRLRRLRISAAFMVNPSDGRTEQTHAVWQARRFSGINAGMLAAAINPVTYIPKKKSRGHPNSCVVIQASQAITDPPALSVVGVLAETAFVSLQCPRSVNNKKPAVADLTFTEEAALWLDPCHGLEIVQTVAISDASMFGVDVLEGFVEWDEVEFERLP